MSINEEPSSQEAGNASAICTLIGETLGIDNVIADEDFFELGGTSLLGAMLLTRPLNRL